MHFNYKIILLTILTCTSIFSHAELPIPFLINENTKTITEHDKKLCDNFVIEKYDKIVDEYGLNVKKDFSNVADIKLANTLQQSCLYGVFFQKNGQWLAFENVSPKILMDYQRHPPYLKSSNRNVFELFNDAAKYGANLAPVRYTGGTLMTEDGPIPMTDAPRVPKYLDNPSPLGKKMKNATENEVYTACVTASVLNVFKFNNDNKTNYNPVDESPELINYCKLGYKIAKNKKSIEHAYDEAVSNKKKLIKGKSKEETTIISQRVDMALMSIFAGYEMYSNKELFDKLLERP